MLIALTARSNGARLIISNRADFKLINSYRKLELEVWPAFILIPTSEQTHGHGTHTWAVIWLQYLKQILQEPD